MAEHIGRKLAQGYEPYNWSDPNRVPYETLQIPGTKVVEALDKAGFPESEWVIGTAIAFRESSFIPTMIGAVNPETRKLDPDNPNVSWDFGLWQISSKWNAHLMDGPKKIGNWFEPIDNAKMAKYLFDQSKSRGYEGWRPWHTYTSGNYKKFEELAKQSVEEYKRSKAPKPVDPSKPSTPNEEVSVGIMPGAQKRLISINYTNGGISPRMVIFHTIEGSLSSADNWFRNPSARVSAHFGVGKSGTIYQWVDTRNRAWANAGANSFAISIENEGTSNEALTSAQVEANAKILAWAHKAHGVPLRHVTSATGSGLGYHRQFSSWSLGGTSCPGSKKIAQRDDILKRAIAIAGGASPNLPSNGGGESTPSNFGPAGSVRSVGSQQKEVNLAGYTPKLVQDSKWGPKTEAGVKWYQKKIGVTADGVWGKATDAAHRKYKDSQKKTDTPSKPKVTVPSGTPSLKRGDKGTRVNQLQKALLAAGEKLPKFGADSDFGKETEDALKSFQGKNKLTKDGIYGKNSEAALKKKVG